MASEKSAPAVTVQGVSKSFLLPHEKISSLKDLIIHPQKLFKSTTTTQKALEDINIEIKKGEFFGIVGRNGSGKSTLLKIIAGIYQPTSGFARVSGKLLPFIELGVGFNPDLTGRENVYLSGALLGLSEAEVAARYEKIVSFAELDDFMDQKLKNYSSGMQVRLAFSVATQSDAEVLLIDEVLAVGDADFQQKCYDYFLSLKQQKKTVIFVTHDMDSVRRYCDRAALIEDSKLHYVGSAEKAAERYSNLFRGVDAAASHSPEDGARRGSSDVKFRNVEVPESIKGHEDFIQVTAEIVAAKKTGPISLSMAISDPNKQLLCGTNSGVLEAFIDEMKEGEVRVARWTLPNIFHGGIHEVVLAATDKSGDIEYDWWGQAASFTVERRYGVPYPVQPNIALKIEEKK